MATECFGSPDRVFDTKIIKGHSYRNCQSTHYLLISKQMTKIGESVALFLTNKDLSLSPCSTWKICCLKKLL